MSALTSLLVRDQVVSVRKIEEAIQRQVIGGGDLESVLLEMDAAPENVISAYRAALFGLLPATRDEVMKVPRETVRLVPREVAEQHRLVPLSAEGRTLVVAVTVPLSPEDDRQLAFLLGHDLIYRVVTEVRLAAALAHHYTVDIQPRLRRLADRLRQRDAGPVPYVAPPDEGRVDRKSLEVPSKRAGDDIDWDDGDGGDGRRTDRLGVPAAKREAPPPSNRPPAAEVGVGRVVGVGASTPAGAAPAAAAAEPAPAPPPEPLRRTRSSAPPTHPTPPDRPAARRSTPPPPPPELFQETASASAKKLRGPLTAKDAVERLAEVANRDEILEVFFVFARQFFDYTALFVVHEDIAEGRDAFGDGTGAADITGLAVPLDVPGTFATVRADRALTVVDLRRGELDAIVARDLGRTEAQPAIIVPVAIKQRVVLMLYGDRGGEQFGPNDLPELQGFLPRVSEAFQSLILKKKKVGYAAPPKEDRSTLKSAATKLGAGAIASDRDKADPGYRSGGRASAVPAEPVQRASAEVRRREGPLGVLGVPRSAPPPPMTPSDFKKTWPDGRAAIAKSKLGELDPPEHRVVEEVPAAPARAPAPESDEPEVLIHTDDDAGDDLDDAEESSGDVPAFARSGAPRPATSGYSMRDAGADVLGAEDVRTPARGSRRAEVKRSRPAVTTDVVHVPDGVVPPVSAPPAAEAKQPRRTTTPKPTPNMPSVIVDMGDTVESLVEDLAKCGPDDEGTIVQKLVALGEAALPTLTQRFPGPLWFDRTRPHRRLPRGRDVSAISRAITAFRDRSAPYVSSLLDASDSETRFYATLVASEVPHPDLLPALARRVFDPDPGTQLLSLDVLRLHMRFRKEMEETLKGIRVEAKVDRRNQERRRVAIRAIGQLRDARSVDLLIDLLTLSDAGHVAEAHTALVVLTRHDFGDAQRRWVQWADKNRGRHRIEWLIDALTDADEGLRSAASDELKSITQEYYGYHPKLGKREREIAQRKYRAWWQDEGRARFV